VKKRIAEAAINCTDIWGMTHPKGKKAAKVYFANVSARIAFVAGLIRRIANLNTLRHILTISLSLYQLIVNTFF